MKVNEIRQTIEKVVRVEYIAEDGTIFSNEEECKTYEESALFVVSSKLKRLTTKWTSVFDFLNEGSDECEVEAFNIETESDLENLRRYLYLKAVKNGARDKDVKECFTSIDGKRKDYVFESVTIGHEVLVFWNYENDWFWVYKDGSLNGYFEWVKEQFNKITTSKENNM